MSDPKKCNIGNSPLLGVSTYICDRERGHSGDHTASRIWASWANDETEVTVTDEESDTDIQRWEYRIYAVPVFARATREINAMGNDGWEAVTSTPTGLLFKRPIQSVTETEMPRRKLFLGDRLVGRPCVVVITKMSDDLAYAHCETCGDEHVIDKKRFEDGYGPWSKDAS